MRTPIGLPTGAELPAACWPLSPPPIGQGVAERGVTTARAALGPPLVLAGDAFSPLGSRFDGCLQSGEGAATAIVSALGTQGGAQ